MIAKLGARMHSRYRHGMRLLAPFLVALGSVLLLGTKSFTGPSFVIQVAFQLNDLEVAKGLSEILKPQVSVQLSQIELSSMTPYATAAKLTKEPNLFILMNQAQASFFYRASERAVATAATTPGPTIHAVTLSTYGSKIIDDTSYARSTWSRKVVSAGFTDFQVGQTRLLFGAMSMRCGDQTPTTVDSVKCQRNDYWDQPEYLVDRRGDTEAFLVWGQKCEGNVKRVYELRPQDFRLISITPRMVGKLREKSQLPYVPDKMNTGQCSGQNSSTGRLVETGTLLYSLAQSSRNPDTKIVSVVAERLARFLLERFPRDDLIASTAIMHQKAPLLPDAAKVYRDKGLLPP